MSFLIRNHIHLGFEVVEGSKSYYPSPGEEFDVSVARDSQQSSQTIAFVGLLKCVNLLSRCAEDLFSNLLRDTESLGQRVSLISDTVTWCEEELATLQEAHDTNFVFQTNFEKEEKMKFGSEGGIFSKNTMPFSYVQQLEFCMDTPQFDLLDNNPLNQPEDESIKTLKQKYSDPYGIFLEWVKSQQARTKRRAEKKKKKMENKKRTNLKSEKMMKNVRKVGRKRDKFNFIGKGAGSSGDRKLEKSQSSNNFKVASTGRKKNKPRRPPKNTKRKPPALPNKDGVMVHQENGDEEEDYPEEEEEDYPEDGDDEFAGGDSGEDSDDLPPDDDDLKMSGNNNLRLKGAQKNVTDIFTQIRGGAHLKATGGPKKRKAGGERGSLLSSIRDFKKGGLKKAKTRTQRNAPTLKNRTPMNVGEILQQQLAFISQVGADVDDDDFDDDDDDDEW